MPPLNSLLTRRLPWLLLLVLVAVVYYGSYVRYGINFRDEGGTVALIGQRLLNGEIPFHQVELGYNILWFYPVVGLFKLFGVNFVLLRAYCFALSTLTAVLAYITLDRVSRRPWLAFLISLLPVFVPGMTFKNYMPLLAVANICCLVHFVLGRRPHGEELDTSSSPGESERGGSWRWLVIGAVVLGLTFLIRIDVGTFVLLLWLGAEVLMAFRPRLSDQRRVALLIGGPFVTICLAAAVHYPVYLDATHRGFARPFLAQYLVWPQTLASSLKERLNPPRSAPVRQAALPAPATPIPAALPETATPAELPSVSNSTVQITAPASSPAVARTEPEKSWNTHGLRPKTLGDLSTAKDANEQALILLRYFPLFILLPLIVWALIATWRGLRGGPPGEAERAIAALLALGGALTIFPQYFFFRSDAPHISEFSPGYWLGAFSALLLLGWSERRRLIPAARAGVIFLLVALFAHAGLFLWRMLPDRWTGTIAARKNRNVLFNGENGVNVYLSKKEVEALKQLVAVVRTHSGDSEKDFLVAYPYQPAINLICNRRTYERTTYVDNATSGRGWNDAAIARFQKFRPNVIVLSDWDINNTEESRFSHWAERTKTWIQTNYINQGKYLDFEVFTRPEKEE